MQVCNAAILDHFAQAIVYVARRQCPQELRVNQYALGLAKAAGLVFAARQVNAYLAADTAVHLSEDTRRNLYKGQAPQEGSRSKTAEVTGYATAEGDDVIHTGNARF